MNGFDPEYIRAAIQNEAKKVALAAASTRNDTLNKAAFNLASLGVPGSEIIHSLRAAALQCGLKNGEIYSTINSGMRAGRQHPRSAPSDGFKRPGGNATPGRAVSTVPHRADDGCLPNCDAPDKFKVAGDDGPSKLDGELRRHVYRSSSRPVRVKIKLERNGETRFQNWYHVVLDGASGWQAQKPAEYIAVPYVGGLDPFDPELSCDALMWPEGEKDVDTLTRLGIPAFTFGGTGDGLPIEGANYLKERQVVILADNDDGGRAHAEKKAALAREAGAASVRIVDFPELPPKADVSDFIEAGGTIEQLHVRIDAAPVWTPPTNSDQTAVGPALVMQRACDVEAKPVEWLWPGRIAIGKQTMLAGEPGLGKSQLSAFLAAIVTTSGHWPNGEGRADLGSVIVLSAEDDAADTIIPRLTAAGADLSRVHIVSAVATDEHNGRRLFNLQTDLLALEAAIAYVGDVRLVIIDPVSSYLGKVDSHKNAEVRTVLEPIGELASRLRVAVVAVTHFSKGGGTSANNRIIGSIAFVAAARAAFIVSRDPDDENRRLFVPSKNNLGPDRDGLAFRIETREVGQGIIAPAVSWDSEPVTRTADEILAAMSSSGDRHTARDDAKVFLQEALANGPISVVDLEAEARAAGLLGERQRLSYNKAIRAAADRMGVVRKREGFGRGAAYHWSLPDAPCVPSGAMLAHACPISKEGTHGTHGKYDRAGYECRDLDVAPVGDFDASSNEGGR
jgi:putative DNA primase/helicase